MGWQAWFTLAVVVVTVAALARDLASPVMAVVAADVVLLVSGVISTEAAFAGFANPAPITVAALFVLAAAVEKTGALQPLLAATLGNGDGGWRRNARLLAPTAAASAFLNNTPIVAMLAPQVTAWAERRNRPASWYLMPISFATILGGVVTVIGTSTNLVVSGLMQGAGMPAMGMFEISRVGLPVALTGIAFLVLFSQRLLPDRRGPRQQFEEDIREYVVHMRVAPRGPLDGVSVEAGGLRNLQGVFLAEIERGGQVIAPAAPTTVLRGDDRLIFAGRADVIRDLQSMRGLTSTEQPGAPVAEGGSSRSFFEVVVSGASPLVGRTLKEVDFRSRYQAAVLAIHRAGERVRAKLGEVRLREGDTLLLVADPEFGARWRHSSEFLLVAHLGSTPTLSPRKGLLVGLIALAIVVGAGAGLVPILHASLLGALALVASGVLTPWEARSSIEIDVIMVIAASFGLGAAIETSGLAAVLGHGIVEVSSGWGPMGVLFAVTLATVILTELITNNAAAVLLFPIALAAAAQVGADPRPFAFAIAIAASASFLTPIGYQTNTMVYGLGGYRFSDFVRLGLPLTLLVIGAIMLFVPLFWSF
ncbi:MAG TPA: SLC13 family permease [Longimicrobiaceae bacterium]|nr:SLC13 family permease [Longimicrobiaceae bacterium]